MSHEGIHVHTHIDLGHYLTRILDIEKTLHHLEKQCETLLQIQECLGRKVKKLTSRQDTFASELEELEAKQEDLETIQADLEVQQEQFEHGLKDCQHKYSNLCKKMKNFKANGGQDAVDNKAIAEDVSLLHERGRDIGKQTKMGKEHVMVGRQAAVEDYHSESEV